ncbi:preprotein translocase subunit SecG [Bartonella rattimassiliensis]|uniref:Protein-export membrane protein SecG n=1 Tax=Bartonella rattimassiliensis 15908 TaxID=1094556 RepID=J1JP69_9HYPH|nr:preprotein translocase subunit SecG [Bartonella rattimassiliensis]EJF86135.1 preprotein translocase, SecG subunit [Bartonella rattimassiliensis 15908]
MQTVLIVIHLLIVITLVGVILIQPSEGGGLGVSNSSGVMKARGIRNPLTRLTAILACCFFVVSIGLSVVGSISNSGSDILKRIPVNLEQNSTNKRSESVPSSDGDSQPSILEQLEGISDSPQERKQSTKPEAENPVPPVLENPVPDNSAE